MENLEATGAFTDVRPVEEHFDDEGLLLTTLEMGYVPAAGKLATDKAAGTNPAAAAAGAEPPASEPPSTTAAAGWRDDDALEAHPRREARLADPARARASSPISRSTLLVVYPLGVKSAGAADRAAAAARRCRRPSAISPRRATGRREDARRAGAGDVLRQGPAGRSAVRAAPDLRDAAAARAQEQRQVHRSPPGSRADQEGRAARPPQDRHVSGRATTRACAVSSTSSRARRPS